MIAQNLKAAPTSKAQTLSETRTAEHGCDTTRVQREVNNAIVRRTHSPTAYHLSTQ